MIEPFKLNEDFILGVATASTQIEGGDTNNSWYEWTKNGDKTRDKSTPLRANRHYLNYKDDILRMKNMGIETYRFSLEWSRIEVEEGKFSSSAMEHYRSEIKLLLDNGIKPLVTMHHFSNPLWFEAKGGFVKKKNNRYFAEYVSYVVDNLKDLVHEYCTINEPNIYAMNCYLFGEWVNEEKSFIKSIKVLKNMARCHISAYKIIHEKDVDAKVGFANHIVYFTPKRRNNLIDKFCTHIFDQCFNMAIEKAMGFGKFTFPLGLISLKKGVFYDYIGINYYTSNEVKGFSYSPGPNFSRNDLGWAIDPVGIRKVCERLFNLFNKEIYITENGTCDKKDKFRSKYIYDHLKELSKLSYVKRYYYWTFYDNFEWKEGESACFGLIEYNYETEDKIPRLSSLFYQDIIKNKEVNLEMINKYLGGK